MLKQLTAGLFLATSFLMAHPCLAQQTPWALHGTVVANGGPQDEWISFQHGKITAISTQKPAAAKTFLKLDGYIYPGLIDTHNHVHYNTIPQWKGSDYANRYHWQNDPEYLEKVDYPFARQVDNRLVSDSILYGEVRAVIGGATMIQSNYHEAAPKQLIRNLDFDEYHTEAYTGPIGKISDEDAKKLSDHLGKETVRLFFHIAEGKKDDTSTQSEFEILGKKGFFKDGVVVIHGIALGPADFKVMREKHMFLVWSPRSNMRLYGETSDVSSAVDAGVTVALSPDWTVTGSSNMLDELRFAYGYLTKRYPGKFTPQNMFDMVTKNAALVAGVDKELGAIEVGMDADFLTTKRLTFVDKKTKLDQTYEPYDNLLKIAPSDVRLVFVSGRPIYGEPALMSKYAVHSTPIKIGAVEKQIAIDCEDGSNSIDFGQLESRLKSVLPQLAPVYEP